jgi:hypothetical protein
VQKEALRHAAHCGGLVMAVFLVLAAATLALVARGNGLGFVSGQVKVCYVDYWHEGQWIEYLEQHVPPDLTLHFRPVSAIAAAGETIYYPSGAGAIQIRAAGDGTSGPLCKVWIWHPGDDPAGLARFEAWFWQESARYFRQQAVLDAESGTAAQHLAMPALEVERSSLSGSADARTTGGMPLVLFAIFFPCVYLLPSWTCEERERGLLMAVALSPATGLEMLAARSMFYGLLALGLAVLVTGILSPAALGSGLLWITLLIAVLGALGVGSSLVSVARTQRTASLAALAYLLGIALWLAAAQALTFPGLSWLALEFHVPRLLSAALSGTSDDCYWLHLAAAAALALAWFLTATTLFRRRGWQ